MADRCARVVELTVQAVQDLVEAGHPRFLVEAASHLRWQNVHHGPIHRLHAAKQQPSLPLPTFTVIYNQNLANAEVA